MLTGLFALLWLLPTIRWRIDIGPVSIALLEPFTILFLALLVGRNYIKEGKIGKITLSGSYVTGLLILLLTWIILARPWGQNFQHSLSDIRDWAIPALACIALISTVRKGWRRIALLFVLVGVLQSCLGLFQHFTNSFRPFASLAAIYKLDYSGLSTVSFAVGLFEHPNSLATYLMIAILIALGWLEETHKLKEKAAAIFSILVMAITMYWTYAKSQEVVLVFLIFLFWFMRYFHSVKLYLVVFFSSLSGIFVLAWFLVMRFPYEFRTVWWRVSLWQSAFQTIADRPITLLVGGGDVLFGRLAIWPQPHSVYLDTLLNYGLPGLFLLLVLMYFVGLQGLHYYQARTFRRSPVMRALWLAMLGFFLNGFVESSFIGIETRMIFLTTLACFIGLGREVT